MEPCFGENEAKALFNYMLSGGWVTEFKKTEEFEKRIADFVGSKYCIAVNNGTITITLALFAFGVKPEDEVIVPNLTMIATPNSVILSGAKPILVDIEKETLCLDINKVKTYITNRTKAIIYVSFNGRSNDMSKIKSFCHLNNLILIEDAAQSLGSFYKNKHLGTFGKIGSFSFSAPKIITTGQGGAIVTDDSEISFQIKKLKDFGRLKGGHDIHDSIGYNFKFTDIQAIVGIEQMKKLEKRIERKKEIYSLYYDLLSPLKEIEFIKTNLEYTTPWFIDIYLDKPDELSEYLRNNEIGSRRIYPAINTQKAYNIKGDFSTSIDYSRRGLWLPSSSKLTNKEIKYICNKIHEFYKKN